jgi:hypothetical protein
MPNDYSVPRAARKLPESDKKTLTPKYLLQHENHFDPNVYTPEAIEPRTGSFAGTKSPDISKT